MCFCIFSGCQRILSLPKIPPQAPTSIFLAKAAQHLHLLEVNGEELVVNVVRSLAEPKECTP